MRTKRSNGRVQNVKDVRAGADEIAPEEVDAEGCERYASVDLGEVEYVTQPQIVVLPNEGKSLSCFVQDKCYPRKGIVVRYGHLEVGRVYLRERSAARNCASGPVEPCDHGSDYGEHHQRANEYGNHVRDVLRVRSMELVEEPVTARRWTRRSSSERLGQPHFCSQILRLRWQ